MTVADAEGFRGRRFLGKARAVNESNLAFEVAGRLIERPNDVGDEVERGQVLANGNLLLFENNQNSDHSRVVEVDPVDFDVRWSYGGSDEQPLYSWGLGTVQRLPNGNTLITESDAGRALEVTPEGEIVWQFHNPQRAGDRNQYIATLPEVLRLPADFAEGWCTGTP